MNLTRPSSAFINSAAAWELERISGEVESMTGVKLTLVPVGALQSVTNELRRLVKRELMAAARTMISKERRKA